MCVCFQSLEEKEDLELRCAELKGDAKMYRQRNKQTLRQLEEVISERDKVRRRRRDEDESDDEDVEDDYEKEEENYDSDDDVRNVNPLIGVSGFFVAGGAAGGGAAAPAGEGSVQRAGQTAHRAI